jgi:hypothetical protein
MDYAVEYADFLIQENHKFTLAEMIIFYWLHKPNHRRLTILNLTTLQQYDDWDETRKVVRKVLRNNKTKGKKNEKNNIININTKLN